MEKSIFSYLKSYIPSESRDAREDYLTQILAWILIEVNGFAEAYCNFLVDSIKEPLFGIDSLKEIKAYTQVVAPRSRIDLLIKLGENGFICEHKISSMLSDNQMWKYKNSIDPLRLKNAHTILITYSKSQHTQYADALLTWNDVNHFLKDYISKNQNKEIFMVKQLVKYLNEQGLANAEEISALKEQLNSLPQGYISKKIIKGKTYYYLQKREGNKIISKYIKLEQLKELEALIETSKQCRKLLGELTSAAKGKKHGMVG